jgi:benzoyl-CoA reductase subunit C
VTGFEFDRIASDPLAWLRKWKQDHDGRIIGCLPMYTPEELVAAAGMLPVELLGTTKPMALVNAYLHPNLCHAMRSNFELALSGEFDFLDGLIFCDICDQTKRLGNLWEMYHRASFSFHLRLPKRLDTKEAKAFYQDELRRFRAALERFSGNKVSDEALNQSIVLYNQVRKLISQLYDLRRRKPYLFSATEVDTIIAAAMFMPKGKFKQDLEQYLETKKATSVPVRNRPRLLICGNPCESTEPRLLEIIEQAGGWIVDDYVYCGAMYLFPPVSEEDDPITALAQAYMDSHPCPTKHNPKKSWAKYIVRLAKQSDVNGVIVLLPKYCEIYAFDYPELKEELGTAGIPHLMLETDHSGATARLRTRVETFMEMLQR